VAIAAAPFALVHALDGHGGRSMHASSLGRRHEPPDGRGIASPSNVRADTSTNDDVVRTAPPAV